MIHSTLSCLKTVDKDDGISIDRSGTELCNIEYSVADAASVEAAAKAAGLEKQYATYNGQNVAYYAFPIGWKTGTHDAWSDGKLVPQEWHENLM